MGTEDSALLTNPAEELLAIFSKWADTEGSSNAERRAIDTPDGLHTHVIAMNFLQATIDEIDRLEAQGRNVRVYRTNQDDWIRAVLIRRTSTWTTATSAGGDFTPVMMNALEGLADVIAHSPRISRLEAQLIGQLLDEVLAATRETTIDERLAEHIRSVVTRLRANIDEFESVSPAAAAEAWNATWAAASAAVAQTSGDERSRWERIRDAFVVPTAVGLFASVPQVALQIAQMSS